MFADDVVLCAREKDVLELELEQWTLEKIGMKVSRAKTENMYLNGTPLGSVHMQSAQLPQVTEFKLWERWWHEYRDKQDDTVWKEQLEEDVRRPMRQESTTTCEGKIHNMIFQPAMLYGMETVPVTSSHVKKLHGSDRNEDV